MARPRGSRDFFFMLFSSQVDGAEGRVLPAIARILPGEPLRCPLRRNRASFGFFPPGQEIRGFLAAGHNLRGRAEEAGCYGAKRSFESSPHNAQRRSVR